jgi:cell division septation protein DedD
MRHAAVYDEDDLVDNSAELSLGMGMLLGIFFGLALVCGVFFGFGYMMGHRTPGPYVSSEPLYVAPKPSEILAAPKPSALVPEQPADASRVILPTASQASVATPPPLRKAQPEPVASPQASAVTAVETARPGVVQKVAATLVPAPARDTPQPASAQSGTIMVQIAAVKNRPDAEALADALRKNGFTPTVRTEPQDKLLHVQVGPFNNRDEAKAMRQKLSSAGYDAFIK